MYKRTWGSRLRATMTHDPNGCENEIASVIYGHAGVTRKNHGRYREADPQRFGDKMKNMFDSKDCSMYVRT